MSQAATIDRLAGDLAETDFDAVERDGYRAAWTDDDATVVVRDLVTDETVTFDGEDLVRATSDRELRDARTGSELNGVGGAGESADTSG
jgi:hypothetical protein